jgi:diguanylate cyclase (GGDEF)-like protein
MFEFNSKKIIAIVITLFILISAWILSMEVLVSLKKLNVVFVTLPYVLAIFALVLSVWFQHSRAFYAVAVLFFAVFLLSPTVRLNHRAIVNGYSLIIPAGFIILAVMQERGITSKFGLTKGCILIIMILVILIDASRINSRLQNMEPAALFFDNAGSVKGIPKLSILLYILCLCILLIKFLTQSSMMDMAFVGASLGSFIILHFTEYPEVLSIHFSAVFLIFIIALFQASYSLAFYDPLTGVLSRRAMEQELLRLGNKYAVAMVDIDHFKNINDRYGHKVGDDVLRMIASEIEKNAVGGKTFRYGGEEFAVIFLRKSAAEVFKIMEQIRYKIEKRPVIIRSPRRPAKKPRRIVFREVGTERVRVTVSIGIADKKERIQSANEVIEKADKALYRAKKSGRNCIRIWPH